MKGQQEAVSIYKGKLPDDIEDQFLHELRWHGNATLAALNLGVPRQTMYERRRERPEFDQKWLTALQEFHDHLKQATIATAMELGLGKTVPMVDERGNQVIDETGRPRFTLDVSGVKIQMTTKLLDKVLRSADGPPVTAVQVTNKVPVYDRTTPPRLVSGAPELPEVLDAPGCAPKLVEGSQRPPEFNLDDIPEEDRWLYT